MTLRRLVLASLLFIGLGATGFAQVPPPVPALPDTARLTTYSPSASTGPFNVNFAIFGDSTDYGNWVEVWFTAAGVAPVKLTAVTDYTVTSPSGSVATLARPITDAQVTLTVARTGTLQIVGARRSRRASQYGNTVTARNLNQDLTDIVAQLREQWDFQNRAVVGQPGEVLTALPAAASRAGAFLGFDGSGQPALVSATPGLGNVVGPGTSVVGNFALWNNTVGTLLKDGGIPGNIILLNIGTGLGTAAGNLNLQPSAAGVIGGVLSKTCGASQWVSLLSTAGVFTCTQPSFSDVSGQATLAQFPTLAANTFLANNTAGSAVPTAVTIPAVTTALGAAGAPRHRITLVTATPIMTTSQTGIATVFVTPYIGNTIPIYDGTNFQNVAFAETSQATTDATKSPAAVAASSVYDIFCWVDSGVNRCTRGKVWTNTTTRADALVMVNGILLNSVTVTNGPAAQRGTYMGTIASNGSSTIDFIYGATASGGTAAVFNVWNNYNRRAFVTNVIDNVAQYTYSSATTRAANASNANRISFVVGAIEDGINSSYTQRTQTPAAASSNRFGIGLDSTTTYQCPPSQAFTVASIAMTDGRSMVCMIVPPLGVHFIQALEDSVAGANTIFNVGTAGTLSAILFM